MIGLIFLICDVFRYTLGYQLQTEFTDRLREKLYMRFLANLQVLPKDGKPLRLWHNRDSE